MRKRITLALILAVLLILIGVLVNPVIVPRTWADPTLKFPLSVDTNAGLAIPSFDGASIHKPNNNVGRLLVDSNTVVFCMNDFVPDAIYDSVDSDDASEADGPDVGLLQLAVTVPTKLPFIAGPSDNSGWIYNFADNITDNQADSDDAVHPDEGGFSSGAGAGPGGGGAPSGGSENKGTPKTPPKETSPGLSDDAGFGYIYGSLYYIAGLPGIIPHNPAGTNGDSTVWLGDPPPIHAFGPAPQNSGDPDTPHGNDPPESPGNGDPHHYNRDHHSGGPTSQTGPTTIFSLTDGPPPLTPIPEPATFSILGVGLIAIGLIRRRLTKLP